MASVAALGFSIVSRYSGHGVTQARRDLATLQAQMASFRGENDRLSKALDAIPMRFKAWGTAIAGIGPALVPLAAQLLATAGALTTMATAAGVAGGVWGLALKGAISRITNMDTGLVGLEKNLVKQKAILAEMTPGTEHYEKQLAKVDKAQDMYNHRLKEADPAQRAYMGSLLKMDSAWQTFISHTQGQTLGVASVAIDGIAIAIGKLEPLVTAVTPVAMSLAKAFRAWADTKLDGWVKFFVATGVPALQQFITIGKNLGAVFGMMLKAFAGDADNLGNSLAKASAQLKGWAEGGGFQRFLDYVHKNSPAVTEMLRQMFLAVGNIIKIFEGFSGASMAIITDSFRAIAALDPEGVKAFANSFTLLRYPMLWLVLNCPPLRDAFIALLGAMNAPVIYAMATAFGVLKIAWMLMNTALLTTPLGWIILGLTALGIAIVLIATKTTWFQTAWTAIWGAISSYVTGVWNLLQLAFHTFVNTMVTVWTAVSTALVAAWNAVWNGMSTAVTAVWNAMQLAWSTFTTALATAWTTVSSALVTAWNTVWTGLQTAAQAVWTALQLAWSTFTTALATAWTTVSTALVTAWNLVWTGLQTAAQAVWTALTLAWTAFTSALATAWTTVSAALTAAWNTVWNALKTAAQAVWTAMQAAWQAWATAIQTIWTTVSGAITAAWGVFWNALKTAAQAVWTAMQAAWQAFLTAVQTVWTTVSAALTASWNAVWNAIKLAAQTIWTAMQAAWQVFGTALNTIWTTVSNILKAAWSAVWNAIKTAATTIWDAIKTAWTAVGEAINTIWNRAGELLKKAWSAVWDTLKKTATEVWDDIKKAVADGINALLTPINKLIDGFNAIAKAVSLDINIPTIKVSFANGGMVGGDATFAAGGTVNFARGGGALGGFAPGRDTVPAILSRGEGVLTPEAMRGIGGAGTLNSLNRKFAGHRGAGRGAKPLHFANGGAIMGGMKAWHQTGGSEGWGFATGGSADPDPILPGVGTAPSTGGVDGGDGNDAGGIIGNILGNIPGGDILKTILGVNGITSAVLGFIGKEALDKAIMPLIDAILPKFGPLGEILGGAAKKIGHGMLDFLIKKDEEKKKQFESMSVAGAQSVEAWAALAKTAMIMGGLDPSQLPKFLALMAAESSGNPNSINTTDINAKNGIPSQGLMQIIPPNFVKYHVAGTSNNILDPLANMAAAAAYIRAVYGGNVPGSPYALGTPGATRGTHLVGENGPEMVNFAGGESVMPAKETASVLSGVGTAPAMVAPAAAPPMPDVAGMVSSAMASGGDAEGVIGQLQQIQEAAQAMADIVARSWSTVTTSGTSAQSALAPVLTDVINKHGVEIPAALAVMGAANTLTWSTMSAQTLALWTAMKAGTYTQAQQTMMVDAPLWMTAMATANTTQWTAMGLATATQWGAMRDTSFAEANDHMSVKMPQWGTEMNEAVSTAWTNMGEATSTAWEGMKEGTREPTNWIIDNSYNNGIRALWNQVAAVIFDDGAKELPSVATLAKGGPVHGPGTGTSDSVPAMLSRGEHVWTAREVSRAGGHHAVQGMRAGVMGRKVQGEHGGHRGCGLALGGWLGGGVSGSSPSVGTLDLKRGSMNDTTEPILNSIADAAKGALAGSLFRRMGGSADVLSPVDWMNQYIKKDDEINKIGSGGPPWIPGVSDVHTTWGGVTVNQRTADMLNAAMALGGSFSASQGSFSTGVAASAGTHDGGGVVDVVPTGDGNVGALRAVGFAAWNRGAAYGSPSFSNHIHAVALGDPTASPAALAQVQSYLAGGNGLADGGPDNFSGGIPAGAAGGPGGGKNVDPADLDQNVLSFDRGGLLPTGYSRVFNGTGKPEPVGHDLVRRGGGDVHVSMPITVQGNLDEAAVKKLDNEVLPKLRQYLAKGTGQ